MAYLACNVLNSSTKTTTKKIPNFYFIPTYLIKLPPQVFFSSQISWKEWVYSLPLLWVYPSTSFHLSSDPNIVHGPSLSFNSCIQRLFFEPVVLDVSARFFKYMPYPQYTHLLCMTVFFLEFSCCLNDDPVFNESHILLKVAFSFLSLSLLLFSVLLLLDDLIL